MTASWPDRPSELFASTLAGAEPVRLSSLNTEFLAEVELAPVTRGTVTHRDGTEIEYFAIMPGDPPARRLPLHLDIHGGPHASWPSGRWLAFHQAIAAAGYVVVLPNPGARATARISPAPASATGPDATARTSWLAART